MAINANEQLRILVIDRSGKGHALCEALAKSPQTQVVFYGPGTSAVQSPKVKSAPDVRLDRPADAIDFLQAAER